MPLPTLQAFLIVHRTEPRAGRRDVYLYSMEFEGEIVVERSTDAACDLARALLARGLTGHVKVIHKETGQHRYTVNIENTAKLTVREDARCGPCFVKWRPNRFLSDGVLHRSGEATLEGTNSPRSYKPRSTRRRLRMTANAGSRIRSRATKADMEKRADFLIAYAEKHGPCTVRGLYYQAEVACLPGIDKTDSSYEKIQRQGIVAMARQASNG
jgi:hypothetical protein